MSNNRISQIKIDQNKIEQDLSLIENWYMQLQCPLSLIEIDDKVGSSLLSSQLNVEQPIHSWYVLKEAFSYKLPIWIINRLQEKYKADIQYALDPFIGCGTTGLSLSEIGIKVDGIEYNPFIRLVSATKAQASQVNEVQAQEFIDSLDNSGQKGARYSWPKLSTFHNSKYFRPDDVRYCLYVLDTLEKSSANEATKNLLKVGVAKALDQLSNLHKDGRALRYIKKPNRPKAHCLLPSIWQSMIAHSSKRKGHNQVSFNVFEGTAKDLTRIHNNSRSPESGGLLSNIYDLVIYSPPYLNNFDYSEIYKLELWMLGFISSYEDWYKLRKSTIRSHHSLKFDESNYLERDPGAEGVGSWLKFMSSSNCLVGHTAITMPPIIKGYFDDMYMSLQEQYRVLKPGGYLVYVVANSRHAYLPIATDIILGKIAEVIGFEHLEVAILKKRNGRTRQKNFLRESVVFMQKPK